VAGWHSQASVAAERAAVAIATQVGLWTLDLVLSNKGTIWQATKIPIYPLSIPAQARLALCGGGNSLKHSDPKALLSSAGVSSPLRSLKFIFFVLVLVLVLILVLGFCGE
jgi:hypothetical protein